MYLILSLLASLVLSFAILAFLYQKDITSGKDQYKTFFTYVGCFYPLLVIVLTLALMLLLTNILGITSAIPIPIKNIVLSLVLILILCVVFEYLVGRSKF
jgi:hypothetical protein